LNESCDVKICDFGLSRNLSVMKGEDLTEYVVTRFYRAPEIMLSSHEYNNSVDVWSIGCTLAEIITGKVLFPGENYIEQVNLIIEKRGTPSQAVINSISNANARSYIESLANKEKQDIKVLTGSKDTECMDLLNKMLDLDPNCRISVEEAIKHPYFESLHDPEDEPVFEGEIDFDFESDSNLSLDDIKKIILKEISTYNQSYYDLL
jgi:serine/threonine protein kinase